MAQSIEVSINDKEVARALKRFGSEAVDLRKVWRVFFRHVSRDILKSMVVKATGGTFKRTRQSWPKLTGLPRPRKRGQGLTLGRKRKRGGRLSPASKQLRDTDTMVRSALSSPAKVSRNELRIATGGLANVYAENASRGRDWLNFTAKDERKLNALVRSYWRGLMKKHGF